MGSTPGYVTVLVAFISMFGTLAGSVATAVMNNRRSARERDERRSEKASELQEERFAKFLAPAGQLISAQESPDEVLDELRQAKSHIELHEPELADGPIGKVLTAADRLSTVRRRNGPASQVVVEAESEYLEAVLAVRSAMAELRKAA